MKKQLTKILAASAAVMALGTQAFGASGQTDVSFNFPDVVILHYVSDVTFDVPATVFGSDSIDEGSGGTLSNFAGSTISGDASVGMTIAQAINGYTGTIQNAWAVRALTGPGGVQVSVAIDTPNATNGGSIVAISNPTVSDGIASGPSIAFPATGMGAANAVYGDVSFDIDFSNTAIAGLHTGAQYTVTAVAI